ncbi:MAG: heme exporter protein CcmD [Sphingomonas sp.]|nr:heme exporter protein CcmD [Sphingomonas sp.]MBA3666330.1 heme exporter protein CcmD [Sphingomonas sp.]
MNQWAFVLAAYGLSALATLGLIGGALISMRRAEAEAAAVKQRR